MMCKTSREKRYYFTIIGIVVILAEIIVFVVITFRNRYGSEHDSGEVGVDDGNKEFLLFWFAPATLFARWTEKGIDESTAVPR